MKTVLPFIISLLFFSFTSAQIVDSTDVDSEKDSLLEMLSGATKKDTTMVSVLDILSDSIKTDSIIIDYVKIKRSLLDSLLRPFYFTKIDTIANDTLRFEVDTVYAPRFRMVIHPITKDTSYVPTPKQKDWLSLKKRLVIDTIKVINPISMLTLDTINYAKNPIWWSTKNSISLGVSEAAFLNWSAGGNNSISGLLKIDLQKKYKKLHLLWNNDFYVRYGLNHQQEKGLRKTDDKLYFNSTFGYRRDTLSNWFYSVKFNFNTQFTNGYRYPNTNSPISKFLAPGYLFLGAGTHYDSKSKQFSIYLSPVTLKSTFVLDNVLSNDGAFGVIKGQKARHEFGILVQSHWKKKVYKNVLMMNRLSLYSDYLHNFKNIDVDWELNFVLTINKYIKANVGTHLIYDDDIKFKDDIDNDGTLETLGPRVQLKQLLNIGVVYTF